MNQIDTYVGGATVALAWVLKTVSAGVVSSFIGRSTSEIRGIIALKKTSWKLIYGSDNKLVICLSEILDEMISTAPRFESSEKLTLRVLSIINNKQCSLTKSQSDIVVCRTKQVASHLSDVTYMHINTHTKKDMTLLLVIFSFEDCLISSDTQLNFYSHDKSS